LGKNRTYAIFRIPSDQGAEFINFSGKEKKSEMPEGRGKGGEARGKMPEKLGIGLLANRRLGD
jgi:hypothetical protein